MTLKLWSCALMGVIASFGSSSARAQGTATEPTLLALVRDEITVTATRQKRRADEVPATVTVIDAGDIEDQLATDLKDIVRDEPGVSVRTAPSRFTAGPSPGRDGTAGFNIRGLEGNRVLIQVDGIRIPDAFSFGAQAVGRGDYVDLDLLKSIEILRGPASALYGSDGLAGAVSFVTRDPEDYLREGRRFGLRGRAGNASADESWSGGAAGAASFGDLSALLAYSFRSGHETETQGTNDSPNITRTTANPQDIDTHSALAKLVYDPGSGHRLRLTGEYYDREVVTEVFSARPIPPLTPTSAIDFDADDEIQRARMTLDWRYEGSGVIDSALAAAYWQSSDTREFSAEDRNLAADRTRLNTFDNRVFGLTLQAESNASLLGLDHSFVFGADASLTTQEGLRDGVTPPLGESFPVRAFPTTDYALAGVFLQDEIAAFEGRLTIVPALRYDHYDLEPKDDPLFPGVPAGQSGGKVSPKLGLVFWPADQVGGFINLARGFKAPLPSQVNNGFSNVVFNYRAEPNPNLKPETSATIEVGARFRKVPFLGAEWAGSLVGYAGRYEDFIEQVQIGGTFTPADPAIFQFVNLGEVDIRGVEGRVEASWPNGFDAFLAASATRGEQTTGGIEAPLNSIDPPKLVGGLSWRDAADRFGGRIAVTHAAEKDDDRVDQVCGAPACFTPKGFTTVDLTAFVNISETASLRFGAFNLADAKYAWWSDVRGLSSASPDIDAYTQPGRNFSVSLILRH